MIFKYQADVYIYILHKCEVYCVVLLLPECVWLQDGKDFTYIQWKLNHLLHSTSCFGLKGTKKRRLFWGNSFFLHLGLCKQKRHGDAHRDAATQHLHEDVWGWRSTVDLRFSLLNFSKKQYV